MTERQRTVALLIDYDNLQICHSRDAPGTQLDLGAVMALAQSYGRVVVARAYAEWNLLSERLAVYKAGIEPAFAPVMRSEGSTREGKSLADTVMVADGVDLLWSFQPDVLVLVTSDKDMIPLARLAKQRGTLVVVLGSDLTAVQLLEMANEFITYRHLVRELGRIEEKLPANRIREEPHLRRAREVAAAREATAREPRVIPGRSRGRPLTVPESGAASAPPQPVSPAAPSGEPGAPATEEPAQPVVTRRRRRRGGRGRRGLGGEHGLTTSATGTADGIAEAERAHEPAEGAEPPAAAPVSLDEERRNAHEPGLEAELAERGPELPTAEERELAPAPVETAVRSGASEPAELVLKPWERWPEPSPAPEPHAGVVAEPVTPAEPSEAATPTLGEVPGEPAVTEETSAEPSEAPAAPRLVRRRRARRRPGAESASKPAAEPQE